MDTNEPRSSADEGIDVSALKQPEMEYDLEKAAAFKAAIEAQQNLPLAIAAGLVAALIGAALWGVVTVATEHRIGWMAVGVGFLVGIAVRKAGRGISKPFGIVGAACALLGCALGNLFSICGFLSIESEAPLMNVIVGVITQPTVTMEILVATFRPMDLVFYGLAVYEGYKFSFREISAAELASLTKPVEAAA